MKIKGDEVERINYNDVRMDNWVMAYLTNEYIQVDWLAMKHLSDGNVQAAFHEHSPVYVGIPLSPEILEKCGFKYGMVKGITTIGSELDDPDEEGDTEFWDKGKMTIVNWGKKGFILSNKSSFDHRVELKHLHQLQNLYYALTQTELIIDF